MVATKNSEIVPYEWSHAALINVLEANSNQTLTVVIIKPNLNPFQTFFQLEEMKYCKLFYHYSANLNILAIF